LKRSRDRRHAQWCLSFTARYLTGSCSASIPAATPRLARIYSVRLFLPNRPVTGKGATKDKATSMITQRYLQEGIVFLIKNSAYCSSQYIIDGLIRRNTPHTIALHEDSYLIENLGLLVGRKLPRWQIGPFFHNLNLCGFAVELLCLRGCIL
jgi:hypothetical protein